MRLEFRNECNVHVVDDAPGVYANFSDETVVILRMPSRCELLELWGDFQREAMRHLGELWSMTSGEVVELWGKLGFAYQSEPDRLYGLRTINQNPPRFAFLNEATVVETLAAMGLVNSTTVRGTKRRAMRKTDGSVGRFVAALSKNQQLALIAKIVCTADLEGVVKTHQRARMGTWDVDDLLGMHTEPADALSALVAATDAIFRATARGSEGAEFLYAPVWFTHYLVKRGIWIWPLASAGELRSRYPASLIPLCMFLGVPDRYKKMAAHVLSVSKHGYQTVQEGAATAFILTTFASNIWVTPDFSPACLAATKGWLQTNASSKDLLSTGINKIYLAVVRHLDLDVALIPHHSIFTTGRRIGSTGVDLFEWCSNPSPRNTVMAQKCLRQQVRHVPDGVKYWAHYLRGLIGMLRAEDIRGPEAVCNVWLVYLMTLSSDCVPHDFSVVDRFLHVNDGTNATAPSTFVGFLEVNKENLGKTVRSKAIRQLRKLWHLAATRDDFGGARHCPFDPAVDQPKGEPGPNRTGRLAMDPKVRSIIAAENFRDWYALAQSGNAGKHHYVVQAVGETKAETIFWPAIPMIVDIILHSPARVSNVRWLDSGERDEFIVDIEDLREVRNPSPLAKPGRKEGFLQLYHLGHGERRLALGMFFNTDKIHKKVRLAFIAQHLPAAVKEMIALQLRYAPMRSPVTPKDPEKGMDLIALERKEPTFPLFRLPDARRIYPPSSNRVMTYWKALLIHCQPLVDAELGRHYPLVDPKGRPHFDMHSMRVWAATTMLESDEKPETVREVMKHTSMGMTFHYWAISDVNIHETMMRHYEGQKEPIEKAAANDISALELLVAEAVHVREDDCVGAAQVMEYHHGQVGFLDFFAHGICVGGQCEKGGKRLSGKKYGPVWRHRACSGCRFRLTGPRFLSGLVMRYNSLSIERQISAKRDSELNQRIRDLEDQGKPVEHLRSAARKNREFRENILVEMREESELIAKCVAMLNATQDGIDARTLLVVGSNVSISDIEVRLEEMHELDLAHRVLADANIVTAAIVEVPPGTDELLNNGLRRIVDSNGMLDRLVSAGARTEIEMFGLLGELILGRGAAPAQIEALLNGGATRDQIDQIAEMIALGKSGLNKGDNTLDPWRD